MSTRVRLRLEFRPLVDGSSLLFVSCHLLFNVPCTHHTAKHLPLMAAVLASSPHSQSRGARSQQPPADAESAATASAAAALFAPGFGFGGAAVAVPPFRAFAKLLLPQEVVVYVTHLALTVGRCAPHEVDAAIGGVGGDSGRLALASAAAAGATAATNRATQHAKTEIEDESETGADATTATAAAVRSVPNEPRAQLMLPGAMYAP
jgi:hypothetical protein